MKKLKVVQIGMKHEHANGKFDTVRRCSDIFDFAGIVDETPFIPAGSPMFAGGNPAYDTVPHLTLEQVYAMKDLDLVLIEVPNLDLVRVALPFAERGIAMHVDKPCGEDLAYYKQLLDLCEKKNVPFQMGYMFRGNPAIRWAIQAVREGVLGSVFEFQADMNHCYGGEEYQQYLTAFRGGIMFNLGCHLIDVVVAMLGRPENVIPFMKQARPGDPSFNNCVSVLEYPFGHAVITVCSRDAYNTSGRRMRIGGTNGSIEFSPIERFDGKELEVKLTLAQAAGGYGAGTQILRFGPVKDRYETQLRDLAAMVRGERQDDYSRAHDHLVHEVTLAAGGTIPWRNIMDHRADENEIRRLEDAYRGRAPYHGELHDHSNSGGTSDGKCTLDVWKKEMTELKMDFAAILDHRQVRHMYQPEWDETFFICGTEPGTEITDSHAAQGGLHYNMLFPEPAALEKLLADFSEFQFEGTSEGHFQYPSFTRERFGELMDAVRGLGGFFVIPHPRQIMVTGDVMDFWYRDHTGIEVFYRDIDDPATAENYPLWTELLQRGKKVWVCAGGDKHNHPGTGALTTIYAEQRRGRDYFPYLRCGDFTCGGVGIRMLLGNARTGGETTFRKNEKLLLAVGDFHESVCFADHSYSVTVLDDKGVVFESPVAPDTMTYFALPVSETARWMRAEVFDRTTGLRIAIGNPIWNC